MQHENIDKNKDQAMALNSSFELIRGNRSFHAQPSFLEFAFMHFVISAYFGVHLGFFHVCDYFVMLRFVRYHVLSYTICLFKIVEWMFNVCVNYQVAYHKSLAALGLHDAWCQPRGQHCS